MSELCEAEDDEESDLILPPRFARRIWLVSWLALNDMLTVHVVHKPTKRSAKLHFLTREAMQIKTMLTRYSEAVLQEQQRLDKEKALRRKIEDKK